MVGGWVTVCVGRRVGGVVVMVVVSGVVAGVGGGGRRVGWWVVQVAGGGGGWMRGAVVALGRLASGGCVVFASGRWQVRCAMVWRAVDVSGKWWGGGGAGWQVSGVVVRASGGRLAGAGGWRSRVVGNGDAGCWSVAYFRFDF
ncbi:uncharacterized protein LOC114264154 [Camellia sinensis]|uniref:uncharacterized protein LOC114264154 n=1 Tax=Camellia sinensis TaxID=4442 RepID=UPI001035CE77|nr:uncharacterized protein LOC114264154 [Camellia sinensis]